MGVGMSYPMLHPDEQSLRRLEQKVRHIGRNAIEQNLVSDHPESIQQFCHQKADELMAKHNLIAENRSSLVQKLAAMLYQACQEALHEQRSIYHEVLCLLEPEDSYAASQ
jgi:hypothetical protein